MAWLARSIANSLKLDDDDYADAKPVNPQKSDDETSSPTSSSRGVKEDLSELTTTLTRQFWGVASFLAPPPAPMLRSDGESAEQDSDSVSGIRTDFVEIGEKFRSGISRLSNNINVSEITKVASSFLQLESDDEDEEERKGEGFEGAFGVTDDVVAFARDLALHPETWLNFPLPENFGDDVGFGLSDSQQEHALAVERLAPELAALRIELCPGYMSESCFWMIYFLLVHPRLDKQDAELLSTPQIVSARALLAPLKNQSTVKPEDFGKENLISGESSISGKENLTSDESSISPHEELSSVPSPTLSVNESNKASDLETSVSTSGAVSQPVNPPAESDEIQIGDKSVTEEKNAGQVKDQNLKSGPSNVTEVKDEDDADDWLKEEESTETGSASRTTVPIEDEDDVSFSDLEEDDGDIPKSYRKSNDSSDKDSRDWVTIE